MYTLDRLFGDLIKTRGQANADYEKVWDAFNRYVTSTMEKRQTLNVANFCKIGWKIEEFQGKARLRPHFQLAESFMRAFNLDAKSHPAFPDRYLAAVEEFNFSKAAIKFSQDLTKDQLFLGLRGVIHQIGEAAAHEQVVIDFEVGKLQCTNRDVQFAFVADLYLREGLEVPEGALEAADYKPSVTFGAPSADALTLSLQGTNQFTGKSRTITADHLGGWHDSDLSPRPGSAIEASRASGHLELPTEVARHTAQVEALHRHIGNMEAEAAKVISEKHLWESHLLRCNELEQKTVDWRKAIAKDHQNHLKDQILHDEARRAQGRADHITQVDMHEFPSFKEPPGSDNVVRQHLHERREHLKEDLDHQCETRLRAKQIARQRDLELELANIQAGQADIQRLSKEKKQKREAERSMLHESWGQDVRLKAVRKAIEDHHKTPAPKHELSGLVSTITSSINEGAGSPGRMSATPRLEPSGALSDRCSTASSRMSGSVRRMPLGAAASLALHKEKMRSTPRY